MTGTKPALRIVAWYLLLAGGWILLSHGMDVLFRKFSFIDFAMDHMGLWILFAVTAVLLFFGTCFTLAHRPQGGEGRTRFPIRSRVNQLLLFAIFSTLVFSIATNIDGMSASNLKQEKLQELAVIANLQADLITSSLQERQRDALSLGQDYDLARHYAEWLSGRRGSETTKPMQSRLEAVIEAYGYSNVVLLDMSAGHSFIARKGHGSLPEGSMALARQVAVSGKPATSPLYHDVDEIGAVAFDVIEPLMIRHGLQEKPVGLVVMHASASELLFPILKYWPFPNSTGETMLVGREGNQVVYLNPLRHLGNTPLEFSRPVAEEQLIAALALRGKEYVGEGVDYRGVPVLAATRTIQGGWVVVAKVDQAEVYGTLRPQRWMRASLFLLMVVVTGLAMGYTWRYRRLAWQADRDREAAERKVLFSHYDSVLKHANDIFMLAELDGRIIETNERAVEATGYSREELLSMNARQLRSPQALANREEQWQFDEHGSIFETELQRKDGSSFPVEVSARIVEVEGKRFRQGIIRDISERKLAEQGVLEAKGFSEALIQGLPDIFFLVDRQAFLKRWNQRLEELLGLSREEMSRTNALAFIHEEDRPLVTDKLRQAFDSGSATVEARLNLTSGIRHYALTGRRVETRSGENVIGIGIDITERKQTEEAIRSSRDLLRSVVENIPLRVFWKDRELRYLGCNTVFSRDAGMEKPKDLYGKDDFQMGWKDQAESYRADDKAVMDSGQPKLAFEEPQTTPDGHTIWLRTSKVPLRDAKGEVSGLLGIFEDITVWKGDQFRLARLNRALQALSACNHVLVRAVDEVELRQGLCRAIVEEAGYLLAWVGYAQADEAKSVRMMASYAVKPGYVEDLYVSWADVPEGRGPVGTAVRTGKTQYTQNIDDNPAMQPWREKALSYGYQAGIALPLKENGEVFGVLTIYAAEPNAFNYEELALLEEMAEDLSYGIHMQRVGVEREQHETHLRQSLEQFIQTIAETLAARDPYTAGHQRRVAILAAAIGVEMGLPEEQVQGIHLAATIHDLGKIHLPAEILSRPGKLTDIEYLLIKEHPQAGYDILKDVKFPWPIADIVLQHHERLDGSGYPQGLKGDQILLEAKILCVADVVEAMSSHRPYRAGRGIEDALQEIEKNRGTLYEPEVVDACLRLFHEKGYQLPE